MTDFTAVLKNMPSYYDTDDGKLAAWVRCWYPGIKKALSHGWQDIETAPKDGSEIWGFWNHGKNTWQGVVMCFISKTGAEFWVTRNDYMEINTIPTHWMPLPTPPEKIDV